MRMNNALLQSHRIVRGVLICSPAQWIVGDTVPCLSHSLRETTAAFNTPPPHIVATESQKEVRKNRTLLATTTQSIFISAKLSKETKT